jgi:hypothetical protein
MQVRASRELIHHVLDVPKSNHGAAGAHRLDRLEVLLLDQTRTRSATVVGCAMYKVPFSSYRRTFAA